MPDDRLISGDWFVEGVREELDVPGEYHYDSDTRMLYYWSVKAQTVGHLSGERARGYWRQCSAVHPARVLKANLRDEGAKCPLKTVLSPASRPHTLTPASMMTSLRSKRPNSTSAASKNHPVEDLVVPQLKTLVRIDGGAGASAAGTTTGASFTGIGFRDSVATYMEPEWSAPSGGG